jgi:hypothetical protein
MSGLYVKIPESELSQLRIHHSRSAIDMSIALPEQLAAASDRVLSGYTEWVGEWQGAQVSIGWDWGCLQGQILFLNRTEIRTNVQLLAADGSAQSAMLTRVQLHEWLESLSWRDGAVRDLVRAWDPGAKL